jgi:hypothetical protein
VAGTAEVGLPWWDRHATLRNKEIVQWSRDAFGHPPYITERCPVIVGVRWESEEHMRAFYRDFNANPSPVNAPEKHAGFVGYSVDETGEPFETWEDAEAWLFASEAPARANGGNHER